MSGWFRPLLANAGFGRRIVACVGAGIGIALTILVCGQFPSYGSDLPIIVAPLGASAVLVFAVPASPLAQPWPVVGGNILSTLIGVAVFQWVPDVTIAAGLAVGCAILAMSLARCLHPPGGAAALTAVIGSAGIHDAGYAFAFAPVGINSIALVAIGMFYHRMTALSYPHQPASPAAVAAAAEPGGVRLEDIDAALAETPDAFDIAREDLTLLLERAEHFAQVRRKK
ncbi:HPP family protein [Sphingomonas sp. 2R-10]|uniref:HPP family protein n=1 Tax=Sphingomonas sp. 2R-10 TaxID=3045148 RepID=UPI000F7B2152|nr:HPP family protein [Sphingomonas sp. 2R-10]MDJ0275824.1 HPP family protein [Sphingomonas sp. 2R-10]